MQFYKQRRRIRKTISDFPEKGDVSHHYAEWKGEHFDGLLSRFVSFGRSANAIDETRADFARVPWGPTGDMPKKIEGHETFKQLWFAGNHSDVGGSYPEVECRLSDLALLWMIEEATAIPHGLKIAPVFSNGKKVPNTGNKGQALHLFPAADGVQHCEVAAMRDVLDARLPAFIRRLFPRAGWKVEIRDIDEQAIVHPSVVERFELAEVSQYAGFGPYRPDGLRNHESLKKHYRADSRARA